MIVRPTRFILECSPCGSHRSGPETYTVEVAQELQKRLRSRPWRIAAEHVELCRVVVRRTGPQRHEFATKYSTLMVTGQNSALRAV
eukprot:scaffold4195_cov28-Tisochrysis_lutea.AAC.4